MEGMRITVGADVGSLVQGMQQAEASVEKANAAFVQLPRAAHAAEQAFKSVGGAAVQLPQKVDAASSAVIGFGAASSKAFQHIQDSLKRGGIGAGRGLDDFLGKSIPDAAGKAGTALKKLPSPSNAATSSLLNLGRVVQDAPFGFLGIANNLNPLLEGFQRLRAQSASTKTALLSLGQSLMGAGGIGLALSVV